jgi:5-methylcytosine-specific restriction endonuclease McrA
MENQTPTMILEWRKEREQREKEREYQKAKRLNRSKTRLEKYAGELGQICFYCECSLTESNYSIDHVIPLSKGGWNFHDNKVLCCLSCNNAKGNALNWFKGCRIMPKEPSQQPCQAI